MKRLAFLVLVIFMLASCSSETINQKDVKIKEGLADLEKCVSEAILSANKGSFLEGECAAEGNIILEKREDKDKITVYALTMYGEYGFENGIFTKISGTGIIPVAITFRKNADGTYTLSEYKLPRDGAYYADSVKKMFPQNLHERALNPSREDNENLKNQEVAYAKEYLKKINRDAKISPDYVEKEFIEGMDVEASNTLLETYSQYPYWIGTLEKIEDNTRYVYEKSYNKEEGIVTFKKYKFDTGEIVEKYDIKIEGANLIYLN